MDEHDPDYVASVRKIKELADEYDSEYLSILGAKIFVDGIVSGHTGWLDEDYCDQPVSLNISVPLTLYTARMRKTPDDDIMDRHCPDECVSREDALRAMTTGAAYSVKQENRLGCLRTGMVANLSVFDCDFLDGNIEDAPSSQWVATIIDGEEVGRA